jgi:hypothetical protein
LPRIDLSSEQRSQSGFDMRNIAVFVSLSLSGRMRRVDLRIGPRVLGQAGLWPADRLIG